ncbi:NUDIX domain-containing protein [Parafrankia sp. EAN1pec]|uniref:NUDIX hydrolase n=1 Tax=Parafrankia sp. (strain EAN1pec) TaxID=298653 RepID=UPI00031A8824
MGGSAGGSAGGWAGGSVSGPAGGSTGEPVGGSVVSTGAADRRSTAGRPKAGVTFTFLGSAVDPPFAAVTSASVVAVTPEGGLVLADLARGLDLPGGHVRADETSVEQTVRREAWEEARIRLGALVPVEVIQSDLFGPDDLTYMVVRAAMVTELAPWERTHESAGRVVLPPAEFLARRPGRRPELLRHLVTAGLAALGRDAAAPPETR